ncbi:MAG: hypothetical protein E7554_09800 [Ruminococcaceae bacterium]|nr:hypothetical protein [Oscillospiraceae bacterium]
MNQCQAISQLLYGTAVFEDEWVVGSFVSQSLLTATFELKVPGSGMPARRLTVVDLNGAGDRQVEPIYAMTSGLSGLAPVRRMKTIFTAAGKMLLLDSAVPNATADMKLSAQSVAKLGMDIAGAISSLQNAGIIHRNIKPRNIVLMGDTWMLDGLEMAEHIRNMVYSYSGAGTRFYMTPESAMGRCDHTTDPYALAVVMYTLLNNNRPPLMGRYDAMSDEAVEQAISRRMRGETVPPLEFADEELDRIIRKALSPNPSLRYSHAAQMQTDLSTYLMQCGGQSGTNVTGAAQMADAVMTDPSFASRWKLCGCLGNGVHGTVYRVRSRADGREYALKLVRVSGGTGRARPRPGEPVDDGSQAIARASSEALMYMQLTGCSHILKMYDFGRARSSGGEEFFWMQTELLSPIPDNIPDERAVAMIGLDVCGALSEIHAKGMTHRDVKPENILWAGKDGYKLSDFGVARMLRETSEATVIGSRSFMAPEILTGLMANKGRKAYSNTVDIYSLGMTMYILLNDGREPFLPPEPHPVTEGDRACAEHRLLSGETLPLPAHCGRELGRIIIRACAADPARRFRTADDMREALLNYLES